MSSCDHTFKWSLLLKLTKNTEREKGGGVNKFLIFQKSNEFELAFGFEVVW